MNDGKASAWTARGIRPGKAFNFLPRWRCKVITQALELYKETPPLLKHVSSSSSGSSSVLRRHFSDPLPGFSPHLLRYTDITPVTKDTLVSRNWQEPSQLISRKTQHALAVVVQLLGERHHSTPCVHPSSANISLSTSSKVLAFWGVRLLRLLGTVLDHDILLAFPSGLLVTQQFPCPVSCMWLIQRLFLMALIINRGLCPPPHPHPGSGLPNISGREAAGPALERSHHLK